MKTHSLEIARERRDQLEAADDQLWGLMEATRGAPEDALRQARQIAERRYRAATKRATARGFVYAPADELKALFAVDEVMDRITALERLAPAASASVVMAEAEALLGGVSRPVVTLSEAFKIYCNAIALSELLGKSPEKRMLEAGIDYGLRCLLMGHATTRPAYGDGGSLVYRRDQLLKIAHPFPENFFR